MNFRRTLGVHIGTSDQNAGDRERGRTRSWSRGRFIVAFPPGTSASTRGSTSLGPASVPSRACQVLRCCVRDTAAGSRRESSPQGVGMSHTCREQTEAAKHLCAVDACSATSFHQAPRGAMSARVSEMSRETGSARPGVSKTYASISRRGTCCGTLTPPAPLRMYDTSQGTGVQYACVHNSTPTLSVRAKIIPGGLNTCRDRATVLPYSGHFFSPDGCGPSQLLVVQNCVNIVSI